MQPVLVMRRADRDAIVARIFATPRAEHDVMVV